MKKLFKTEIKGMKIKIAIYFGAKVTYIVSGNI